MGFDPGPPRCALAARAHVDGGAGGRARRPPQRRVATGRRSNDRAGGALATIRVLIADDHAVVRQGLRTFLELQEDIEVVADACDGEEAVAAASATAPTWC